MSNKFKVIILPVLMSLILQCINTVLLAQELSGQKQIEDSIKYKNIEINILSATITKEKQRIIKGLEAINNELIIHDEFVKPKKGEAFGIIQFTITNKGEEKTSLEFTDMHLVISGLRKTFGYGIEFNSGLAFGRTNALEVEGGGSTTDNLLFAAPEKGFKNATLQYGGHAPIDLDFKVQNKVSHSSKKDQ
jgi:hypothetical protein